MARSLSVDTVFINARVVTMDRSLPRAYFVAVGGGQIMGLGGADELGQFTGPRTRVVDCAGMALLPGFIDAHCHFLALASSLRAVDCRPETAGSISSIVDAIRRRADASPRGRWIRATGYDEYFLAEGRHPTRHDLDIATADHPVRLDHRTGHASVLNSLGLRMVGISAESSEPDAGVIDREPDTGEPTGVLFEMSEQIRRATGRPPDDEMLEGVRRADRLLLSKGITALQDASPANDLSRWRTFLRLTSSGHITPWITMMVGARHIGGMLEAGLQPRTRVGTLSLGAAKLMVTMTTGRLSPQRAELREAVLQVHKTGFQAAIHAVEWESVDAALDALEHAQTMCPDTHIRHRIEHCSECPPQLLAKIKLSNALVVTQPSFIHYFGARYRALTDPAILPHIYPLGALVDAGVVVAAGSDAPVGPPNPIAGIYAATTRTVRDGGRLSPGNVVPVEAALAAHTSAAAYSSYDEGERGSIVLGKRADMVLLDRDPTRIGYEEIRETQVITTIVGGRVVWES